MLRSATGKFGIYLLPRQTIFCVRYVEFEEAPGEPEAERLVIVCYFLGILGSFGIEASCSVHW